MKNSESVLKNGSTVQTPLERFGSISGREEVSQRTLDSMILKCIIEETQSLRIVDQPAFINLVRLGLPKQLSIMCSKTLKTKINNLFFEMKTNLIETLGCTSWVLTTANCRTQGKQSFLGMTVHWIDNKTLERKSAILSCSRIQGKHSYDVLAQTMFYIQKDYKIAYKIISCTTDNGSNFVRAFTEFSSVSSDDDKQEDTINFIDLFDILNNPNEEDDDYDIINLPLHRRCASHSINLIATNDIDKALNTIEKQNKFSEREKKLIKFKKLYKK